MWLDHLLSREINGSKIYLTYKTIHPEVGIYETIRVLFQIILSDSGDLSTCICFQIVLSSVFTLIVH